MGVPWADSIGLQFSFENNALQILSETEFVLQELLFQHPEIRTA